MTFVRTNSKPTALVGTWTADWTNIQKIKQEKTQNAWGIFRNVANYLTMCIFHALFFLSWKISNLGFFLDGEILQTKTSPSSSLITITRHVSAPTESLGEYKRKTKYVLVDGGGWGSQKEQLNGLKGFNPSKMNGRGCAHAPWKEFTRCPKKKVSLQPQTVNLSRSNARRSIDLWPLEPSVVTQVPLHTTPCCALCARAVLDSVHWSFFF